MIITITMMMMRMMMIIIIIFSIYHTGELVRLTN